MIKLVPKFLVMAVLTLVSFYLQAESNSVKRCRRAAPSLDCDTLSKTDLSDLKRLCHSYSLSKTCGDHICDGQETDRNCPSDCKDGKDYSFEWGKSGTYNARTQCPHVKRVYDPKSIEEVQNIIRSAKKDGLSVKPLGASHTDNEQVCTNGVVITSRSLKYIYGIENYEGQETVRAQAGVTIGELGTWLHQLPEKKSLGHAIVGYEKVQLAGVIGTGAHGSSVTHTALLSDIVVSMRMVLADGSIQEFSAGTTGQSDPELWKALRLNLGLLGYVYDVRLKVQDDFLIHVHSKQYTDEKLFKGNGIVDYIKGCNVAHVYWFPERKNYTLTGGDAKGKVIVHCGKNIYKKPEESWEQFGKKADLGAQYALHTPEVSGFSYHFFKQYLHKAACNPGKYACRVEYYRRRQVMDYPPYLKKRGMRQKLKPYPRGITGWSHKMQNSRGSAQGDSFRQTDWEVSVPASDAVAVFSTLRDIFADKSRKEKGYCLPLVGLYTRFTTANDTLLSHGAADGKIKKGDLMMFMEIPEFLPSFAVESERDEDKVRAIMNEYERPFREFVMTMVDIHGARIHWAKNRYELFDNIAQSPLQQLRFRRFAEQAYKMDPSGVFSNHFSRKMAVDGPSYKIWLDGQDTTAKSKENVPGEEL